MDLLAAASAQFEHTVAALPPTSWDKLTPCDLTVHEVVDHVVAGNIFAVRLLAGASATEATANLGTDQLGNNPLQAAKTSCEDQLAAFATADQTQQLHHPSGDITYETFVRFRLGELAIHTWDLATGAALNPTLNPAVVTGLWTMVAPHINEMRNTQAFGPGASPNLPPNASPQTRLLDAFGRRP